MTKKRPFSSRFIVTDLRTGKVRLDLDLSKLFRGSEVVRRRLERLRVEHILNSRKNREAKW